MAGLIGLVRSGRFKPTDTVVFVHTGGVPALFAYEDILTRRIAAPPISYASISLATAHRVPNMKLFIAGLDTETNTFAPIPTGSRLAEGGHRPRRCDAPGPRTTARRSSTSGDGSPSSAAGTWPESLCAYAEPGGTVVRAVYESLSRRDPRRSPACHAGGPGIAGAARRHGRGGLRRLRGRSARARPRRRGSSRAGWRGARSALPHHRAHAEACHRAGGLQGISARRYPRSRRGSVWRDRGRGRAQDAAGLRELRLPDDLDLSDHGPAPARISSTG